MANLFRAIFFCNTLKTLFQTDLSFAVKNPVCLDLSMSFNIVILPSSFAPLSLPQSLFSASSLLLARHPALRTCFFADDVTGDAWSETRSTEEAIPDHAELHVGKVGEEEFIAAVVREAEREFDIQKGPLLRYEEKRIKKSFSFSHTFSL